MPCTSFVKRSLEECRWADSGSEDDVDEVRCSRAAEDAADPSMSM